jgi:hypothetical protein
MTVIAWDGKILAADRMACSGSRKFEMTKILRVRSCLIGSAGDADISAELEAWFISGGDPTTFPAAQRDDDKFTGLLVIQPDGVWKYERTPYPFKYESKFVAIGSGSEYALAAMHLGKNAIEAVQLAIQLDPGCGMGFDSLTFEVPFTLPKYKEPFR